MAAQPAFADSTSTATNAPALSPIEDSLNQLISAKEDVTLSPSARTYAEVTARESILEGVLGLSISEVSSTQSKLNSLPNFAKGSKELALQNKYLGQLGRSGGDDALAVVNQVEVHHIAYRLVIIVFAVFFYILSQVFQSGVGAF